MHEFSPENVDLPDAPDGQSGAAAASDGGDHGPCASGDPTGAAAVRCSRCGDRAEPTGHGHCARCGAFVRANTAALVHGGRRLQLGREQPIDVARRVDLREAVLADLGGRSECSAVLIALVEDFAAAVLLRDLLFAHLAVSGPLTSAGRKRACTALLRRVESRGTVGRGDRHRAPARSVAVAGNLPGATDAGTRSRSRRMSERADEQDAHAEERGR
jgi:hypothetical protein